MEIVTCGGTVNVKPPTQGSGSVLWVTTKHEVICFVADSEVPEVLVALSQTPVVHATAGAGVGYDLVREDVGVTGVALKTRMATVYADVEPSMHCTAFKVTPGADYKMSHIGQVRGINLTDAEVMDGVLNAPKTPDTSTATATPQYEAYASERTECTCTCTCGCDQAAPKYLRPPEAVLDVADMSSVELITQAVVESLAELRTGMFRWLATQQLVHRLSSAAGLRLDAPSTSVKKVGGMWKNTDGDIIVFCAFSSRNHTEFWPIEFSGEFVGNAVVTESGDRHPLKRKPSCKRRAYQHIGNGVFTLVG